MKLKFISVLFNSVYPTHPSDNVTKCTIYLPMFLIEWLFKWSLILFCYFILWLAKLGSKMHCILLFEVEYLLEFVCTNPPFLSHPSDTKIQAAIIRWQLQQKSQNLKTYAIGRLLFFDRQISRSIIQPKLIDCPSGTFINFVIATNLYRKYESKT